MTIKEKLLSMGLGPKQTAEILLLLSESYTNGFCDAAIMAGSEISSDIVANMAIRAVDKEHSPFQHEINLNNFSQVFGVDLTNDIP